MTGRRTTVAVSDSKTDELDRIAEDTFGDAETVPYGVTVTFLADAYDENRRH